MNPLRIFLTGPDRPQLANSDEIDRLYKRHRLRIMLAITIGYGLVYTCRLALSMVKKPLIDGGAAPKRSLAHCWLVSSPRITRLLPYSS